MILILNAKQHWYKKYKWDYITQGISAVEIEKSLISS
jgi:hypothetical protein